MRQYIQGFLGLGVAFSIWLLKTLFIGDTQADVSRSKPDYCIQMMYIALNLRLIYINMIR